MRIAFGRGKRKPWKKVRSTGGMCFTVSWDRFQDMLKNKEALHSGFLGEDEYVERFEVNEQGVTVFFEGQLKPATSIIKRKK